MPSSTWGMDCCFRCSAALRRLRLVFVSAVYAPTLGHCFAMFNCAETARGSRMEKNADVRGDTEEHGLMQLLCAVVILVVGLGTPLGIWLKVRSLQSEQEQEGTKEVPARGRGGRGGALWMSSACG
mgnify:CR=1 FL=1